MSTKYNVDRLMAGTQTKDSFIKKLNLTQEVDESLRKCKELVRRTIREAFSNIREELRKENIAVLSEVTAVTLNTEQAKKEVMIEALKSLTPKFKTQGSYSYKTLNNPCQTPPQQIDIDDGVYLPMRIFEGEPVVAKDAFFQIIDRALENLCKKQGWHLNDKKNNCVRVIVNELIHIDVPLYAIPEARYAALTEAALSMNRLADSIELDPSEVYLALREGEHWQPSDPKEVEKWFNAEANKHSHLRNICRFLKAWRDFNWEDGDVSSIALMVCATETMNNTFPKPVDLTDALLAVTKALPSQLSEDVRFPFKDHRCKPVYPKPSTTVDVRQNLIDQALNLYNQLEFAFNHSPSKPETLSRILSCFGSRVPNNVDYITENSTDVANLVRQTPKTKINTGRDIPRNLQSG